MTKINYGIITGLAVQLIVFIWFFSAQNHKIEILYDKFEKENEADVIENQVKMKLDLENIIIDVKELRKVVKKLKSKDQILINQNEVITSDHQRLFQILENPNSNTSGYSYGG
mgnify:CR=1 FL=1|tara:strand:+ start:2222 stop:2560 length:339 start_codon:yes stop_codon:yes gene_type:complete